MEALTTLFDGDFLELLRQLGGFYECPKTPAGERRGPLVGYAGRDDAGRQYVGDVYVNFAKVERYGSVLRTVAAALSGIMPLAPYEYHGFCGAPEGGKALATALAVATGKQYIFPERKVRELATATSREIVDLIFDRHEPGPGEKWWITEDICNNFSTTAKLVSLIEGFGAEVCGVVCFLNRSLEVDTRYQISDLRSLPIVALVRKSFDQYRQDDPFVAADVASGNVVWKPKNDWSKLQTAMETI